jgi:hypothetical protein
MNPTVSMVESQIKESLEQLEELLPQLGHSQSKRLLLAAMRYPMTEESFSEEADGQVMILAFSATKRVTDALVALGVETVIEQMVSNQMKENEEQQTKEGDNV